MCPDVSPIFHNYGDRLTVRAVKMMLDGALGSWGAALLEPYSGPQIWKLTFSLGNLSN